MARRTLIRFAVARLATPLSEDELHRPAVVFAPHPDDETLGCGGTILRKRRSGAEVQIAFLTDGAASHPHMVSRAELGAVRAREALAAAEALGVSAQHVSWLGFPDGELRRHHQAAVSRVTALLEGCRPTQIFAPYARGEHPDHVAAHAIVHEAVMLTGRTATLLEYPIWSWHYGSGLRLLAELRVSVPIRDLIGQKRAALERHLSQMQRWNGDFRWRTLGDIDGGEFLAGFFQDHEVYRRVEVGPPSDESR